MAEFLKLKRSNCKNCYRCIRACPVKSIRFSAGQANIVGDECILCGQCFVVCPQNAKEIASGVEQVKVLLAGNAPVYASVAPSFIADFDVGSIEDLREAMFQLGFFDVQEMAIGAEIVSREYEKLIRSGERDVVISSACPPIIQLIRKYGELLREEYLEDGIHLNEKGRSLYAKTIASCLLYGTAGQISGNNIDSFN